jgi:hypothetical protein
MRLFSSASLATMAWLLAACSSGSGEATASAAPDAASDDGRAGEGRDGAGADVGIGETGVVDDGGGAPGEAGDNGEAGTTADASDGGDGGDGGNGCSYSGAPGDCITVSACAALSDHTSFAGYCPGPASIECCIVTPSTADNPPTPAGYMLMPQSAVTSAMTTWAVQILDDPAMYPMFSTAMQTFGTLMVLARVEWHPPDFNNSAVHRGVTLYEPI